MKLDQREGAHHGREPKIAACCLLQRKQRENNLLLWRWTNSPEQGTLIAVTENYHAVVQMLKTVSGHRSCKGNTEVILPLQVSHRELTEGGRDRNRDLIGSLCQCGFQRRGIESLCQWGWENQGEHRLGGIHRDFREAGMIEITCLLIAVLQGCYHSKPSPPA